MELLPSRSWDNSKKWSWAARQIPKQKNANNKVNQWELELATYNTTFKWILGAHNKAADSLSHLVELPLNQPKTINMLSTTHPDGPAFHIRSRTAQQHSSNDPTPQTDATAPVNTEPGNTTPKSLSADRLEALLQMQKTDPFCKWLSKQLSNGKTPWHEADLFVHVKGLLCKHHRLTPKVLGSGNPQGMEIHGISRST